MDVATTPPKAPASETKSGGKYGLIIPPKRNRIQSNSEELPDGEDHNAFVPIFCLPPTLFIVIVPIIKRNAVPGIEKIKDPSEKYLYDIKHRPDNVVISPNTIGG